MYMPRAQALIGKPSHKISDLSDYLLHSTPSLPLLLQLSSSTLNTKRSGRKISTRPNLLHYSSDIFFLLLLLPLSSSNLSSPTSSVFLLASPSSSNFPRQPFRSSSPTQPSIPAALLQPSPSAPMKMRRHPYTQHTPKRTKLHASHAGLMSAEKPKRPLQPAEKETGPVFTLDQLHLPSCDTTP
jgi:hypothetical protein